MCIKFHLDGSEIMKFFQSKFDTVDTKNKILYISKFLVSTSNKLKLEIKFSLDYVCI